MFNEFFDNPYILYLISPAVIGSVIAFILLKAINLGEFKERFKNLEKNLENLDKDTNKIKNTIKNIEMDLTIMKAHLIAETGMDTSLFSKNSPLTLTSKGENLLEQTEFRTVYKENKDWFLNEIRKHNVETESDIDEASYKVMEYCRDNEKFIDYKEIAYQNGLTTEVLLKVLAIYLREEAIKELFKKDR